ncbi:YdeI/OmpD-associated family protein [Winogradskyella aurantiaca]|uniref:YdeI/OmpD-associated family protein n=1 Tax=Winogradskyella aurantiaca TaxID=2219558 RepID=UPI000E1DCF2D|nr:DUF1801 domain-containing protein [Winogradskyella aurantiaca]
MGKITSTEEYIAQHPAWAKELTLIASIFEETELEGTIKWSAPVYTLNGKNVAGLGAFKNHYGIWFFNGVFLSDPKNLLINAQEDKTKALRQMRFSKGDLINKILIKSYLIEAIENEKLGKRITPERGQSKSVVIPEHLAILLKKDAELNRCFMELSPFKQKEFCEHIASAKREATKLSRLEKIKPMILSGIGLNDKYRK